MDRVELAQILKNNRVLLDFLVDGCCAEYDTRTGEIRYTDPGDGQSRLGLESVAISYPELGKSLVCVRGALEWDDEIKPRTDEEQKRYISLRKLVQEQ